MESITNERKKEFYLKSKAKEIRSLKRRLEQDLAEFEEYSKLPKSQTEQKQVDLLDFSAPKQILSQAEVLLSTVPIEPTHIEPVTEPMDKKERLTELLQYGFEVKYLPLARYLQTASKYISTATWCVAREEFRLARVFERYRELRTANTTQALQLPRQQLPKRATCNQDALLMEMKWMSEEFRSEREWKQAMAKQLAHEARDLYNQKRGVWTTSKAVNAFSIPVNTVKKFFYAKEKADVPEVGLFVDVPATETPIERDEFVSLSQVSSTVLSTSTLCPSTEYQLGTLASFASTNWYEHEDVLLAELSTLYPRNWSLISHVLNLKIYCGKPIRGPVGCELRCRELNTSATLVRSHQLSSQAPPLLHPLLLEKHNLKFTLMRGASTKIITPRSVVPKKISFNVHPSHDSAARKANQNISKLLTPSELAQRRLQRTRLINEAGALGVPQIPRSTPSPGPQTTGNSGALNIPNLPPISITSTPVAPTGTNGANTNLSHIPNNSNNLLLAQQQQHQQQQFLRPPPQKPMPPFRPSPFPPSMISRPPPAQPSAPVAPYAHLQQQQAQMQQMYAKAMGMTRPPPPVMARPPMQQQQQQQQQLPNRPTSPMRSQSPSNNDSSAQLRTSPRKSSNNPCKVKLVMTTAASSSAAYRVLPENEAFEPNYKSADSPAEAIYRKLWGVTFYDQNAKMVSLEDIERSGPFIGLSGTAKTEGIKEIYKKPNFKVSIRPVIEYSLELPYGRNARVWVNSEVASYRIMSVSAEYGALWIPFFHMVNFAGHVVNVLINFTGKFAVVKFILRVSSLSKFPPEECFKLWNEHRKFIQGLLKDQNLPKYIRHAYLSVAGSPRTWSMSWEETFREGLSQSESAATIEEEIIGSMPDVSDPSSDDYAFIETLSRSTSPTLKTRNFEQLTSFKFSVAAVPVQLESFQWMEKQGTYQCPQCSMTFTALLSFEVHLRAHLPSAMSSIKFDSSYDDRVELFLKTLNRFATERKTSLEALRFEKRLALGSVPSAPLKPVKLLIGEDSLKLAKSSGNTNAPTPLLSKNAKKNQKQTAEKMNELSLKSKTNGPSLQAVDAVGSGGGNVSSATAVNARASTSMAASSSAISAMAPTSTANARTVALANAKASKTATTAPSAKVSKSTTTAPANANASKSATTPANAKASKTAATASPLKSASPVKISAPISTSTSANAQPVKAAVITTNQSTSASTSNATSPTAPVTTSSNKPQATKPAPSAKQTGLKSPLVSPTSFGPLAFYSTASSTPPSRPKSPTVTKINLMLNQSNKPSLSTVDAAAAVVDKVDSTSESPNNATKKPKLDPLPQAQDLLHLQEALSSPASDQLTVIQRLREEKAPIVPVKRSNSTPIKSKNLTIDLTADSSDVLKVTPSSSSVKKVEDGRSAFAQGPIVSPIKPAPASPGPIKFAPYVPSSASTANATFTQAAHHPVLPPLSQLLQERPNDSYVLSLRQFISKSSDSPSAMASSAPLSGSLTPATATTCWNCFNKLPVDVGSGEAIYPCPLCKVKKPIL